MLVPFKRSAQQKGLYKAGHTSVNSKKNNRNNLILRKRRGQAGAAHFAAAYVFCFYLAAVLCATAIPTVLTFKPEFDIYLIPLAGLPGELRHYAQNVALFLPLGLLLPALWAPFEKAYAVIAAGFLLSLMIEISQLFCFRATDINDLMMNTLGTAVGFCLYAVAKKLFPRVLAFFRAGREYPRWEPFTYAALLWLTAALAQPFVSLWMWGFAP